MRALFKSRYYGEVKGALFNKYVLAIGEAQRGKEVEEDIRLHCYYRIT